MTDRALTFAEWFGMGYPAGRLMAALFAADTVPLTAPALADRAGVPMAAFPAAMAQLTAAANPGEIITDGWRFALTEDGCADCLAALADAERRAAA